MAERMDVDVTPDAETASESCVDSNPSSHDQVNTSELQDVAHNPPRLLINQTSEKDYESPSESTSITGMLSAEKSLSTNTSSTSLSAERRKKKQVCRKSTASQSASSTELSRLKFINPGKQNEDLEPCWNHGSITRGFKRQHTLHINTTSTANTSTAAELDRLRFSNPGRQNTDLKPINWMQEGVYMTRGHRRQMELHAKLCEANSSDPPLYDSRGLLLSSMQDRCDCMRQDCPGCFLPCRRCHTTKCGPLCRIMRNFHYEKAISRNQTWMWYTKNQSSLASSAIPAGAAAVATSAGGVCGGSTVGPSSLPSHNHRSVPPLDSPASLQQQQHPPAKMVNRLKSLVSKKKKRFQADGFDLDLSYISPRIIAMGFPAERIEGLYRNHIDEVSRFFELRHKGHYKIYHLCNERDFNEYRFSGPVVRYPFSDHNAPQFEQILALCQDVVQFLKQHPNNVVAINCKAGKGRTGVMVCACLMELQEARNAEEALRLYAEKRTRNGQGVTIPSQRRYVQYYSRLLSSALSYEPTPLRLTSIRIEGLPHQLHGVQNFELSISTYENRLSINHNHDPASVEEICHSQGNFVSSITTAAPTIIAASGNTAGVTDNSDYDCHRYSDVTTYQIPCSTHHSDSGSYVIRLDEPVTMFEDFRIKIKAKSGVLTKKIGQCWLNTFFILLSDAVPTATVSNTSFSEALTVGCCSTSDSNSGSGSSSDSSASAASSTSSSVRNSPPHFTGVNEEEEEEIEDEEEDDDDEEELPTLTSNSTLLHSSSPAPPLSPPSNSTNPADSAVMMRRSSNPLRLAASKAGVSMPFVSIPKRDNGSSSYSNLIKKSSPNTNLMLSPSLSTQLATPLAVRVLELSQSELDAATKCKGKKGEEFKILFEFIREAPCTHPAPICSSVNSSLSTTSYPAQRAVTMELEGVEELKEVLETRNQVETTDSLSSMCLQHHHHSFQSTAESTTNRAGALVS